MIIPVQITFRGMEPSDAIAARIRAKAEKLDRFHERITTVRVVFEQLHRHHQQGNLFHVRIDLTAAGGEVVAGSERHDEQAHEDAYVAIRDAFDAVRRRLEDFARVQDNRSKVLRPPPHGTVSHLDSVAGWGRISTSDGRDVYFHQNSVEGEGFHRLRPGSPVRFDLYEGEGRDGPQASIVRPIGKHHFPEVAGP